MKVNVKWNKQVFNDVEVDTDMPPEVFKAQLYSLTGVPVERQKVMGKGGLLGNSEWGKVTFKEGMTVMLMGTADALPITKAEAPQFIEDLPEEEQHQAETREYGAGLVNLGNTCYMNATMQCLYAVPELKSALESPSAQASGNMLTKQGGALFKQMARGGTVEPGVFLMALRQAVPQFDQMSSHAGPGGARIHAQQDAEECWTAVMNAWRTSLRAGDNNPLRDLFAISLKTELKCSESEESVSDVTETYNIKCNINVEINHMNDGIKVGLVEDREMNSEALGRVALWKGEARIDKLPAYLTVQVMRFYYKVATQNKAKIMRKVTFPLQLDLFDFCTEELRNKLRGPRRAHRDIEDARVGMKKDDKAADADNEGDEEMADASEDYTGALTGRYDLIAVLTHKGRSPDSGHYVGWVKQAEDSWMQFDDDKLIPRKDEEILQLSGGGDWHTAYMMLFRAQRVPAAEAEAKPAEEQAAEPVEAAMAS